MNFCLWTELKWPSGTYGLPKPVDGCPMADGFEWKTGYRFHDTEDDGTENQHSDSFHLAGEFSDEGIKHEFCIKMGEEGGGRLEEIFVQNLSWVLSENNSLNQILLNSNRIVPYDCFPTLPLSCAYIFVLALASWRYGFSTKFSSNVLHLHHVTARYRLTKHSYRFSVKKKMIKKGSSKEWYRKSAVALSKIPTLVIVCLATFMGPWRSYIEYINMLNLTVA